MKKQSVPVSVSTRCVYITQTSVVTDGEASPPCLLYPSLLYSKLSQACSEPEREHHYSLIDPKVFEANQLRCPSKTCVACASAPTVVIPRHPPLEFPLPSIAGISTAVNIRQITMNIVTRRTVAKRLRLIASTASSAIPPTARRRAWEGRTCPPAP